MDVAVKKIRPKDQVLATVQDNLANPLQQVLDFCNQLATRCNVFMGTFYSTSFASTQQLNTTVAVDNAFSSPGTFGYTFRRWYPPRGGIVTAITANLVGTITSDVKIQLCKNGLIVAQAAITAGSLYVVVLLQSKPGYAFVSGDVFTCTISATSGASLVAQVDIEVVLGGANGK